MRTFYIAAFQMAADDLAKKEPSSGWPGDLAVSSINPVSSFPQYIERLIEGQYIETSAIGKLCAATGVKPYPGRGPVSSVYSPFKIYLVKEEDLSTCLFAASKNFTFGIGCDPRKAPFGDRGFIVCRKGGDFLSLSKEQSRNSKLIGLMPGKTSPDDPGVEGGNFWE